MNSIRNNTKSATPIVELKKEEVIQPREVKIEDEFEEVVKEEPVKQPEVSSTEEKIKKSFFDKYIEKIKEFIGVE